MSLYKIVKPIYKRIIPVGLRSYLADTRGLVGRVVKPIRSAVEGMASHDEIYDRQYFDEHVEPSIKRSVQTIADSIAREFSPSRVIDVGCGTGSLLAELKSRNIEGIGLEYADAAIEIAKSRHIDVRKVDLENDDCVLESADLVISMEVAEHLPESSASRYVDLLTTLSQRVLITAAPPGQGGTDHVNEQPNEYWIAKFEDRGFRLQAELTAHLRKHWNESGVVFFYANNVMLFMRDQDV